MNTQVILCLPFGSPGYVPGPLHTLTECQMCNRSMWIGPLQKKKLAESTKEEITLQCVNCVIKEHGPDALQNINLKSLSKHNKAT